MAENKKSSFLELLGDAGKGIAERVGDSGVALFDAVAEQNPIVGRPVQALLNTQGYQDRETERQIRKEALLAERLRNQEYVQNASSREKGVKAQDLHNDEFIEGASSRAKGRKAQDLQADEFVQNASGRNAQREADKAVAGQRKMAADEYTSPDSVNTRKQQLDAENSRARLAEEVADQTYMNQRTAELVKGLQQELATNPAYAMMSFEEQKSFSSSPRTKALVESKYYLEEIMKIAGKDSQAFNRMARSLQSMGWSLVDGEDGVKYLDMGGNGMLPATREGIQSIQKIVSQSAMEELNTRARISDSSTLGDPALRSIARRTRELMPFNNNDATASSRMVEGIFNQAGEEEKGWHIFNQAIKDYNDSGLPPQAKMAGIQKCLPFVRQLGYAVDFDPKNPDPSTARIYDIKNKKNISFGEFAEVCKQNDTLSTTFDNHFRNAGVKYEQMQKQALLKSMKEANPDKQGDSDEEEQESKAFNSYRRENIDQYTTLTGRESEKLKEAYQTFKAENHDLLSSLSGKDITKEDLDTLKVIDLSWTKVLKDSGLDPSKLPSPVKEEISRIELPDLYKQREGLQSSPELKARDSKAQWVLKYLQGGLVNPSNCKAIADKIKLSGVENKIKDRESFSEK